MRTATACLRGDDGPFIFARTVCLQRLDERLWINARQYFDGVPLENWRFKVGGYQVCEKWLKDRKGRQLDFADIRHYGAVVAALTRTRALMQEIDATASGTLWPAAAGNAFAIALLDDKADLSAEPVDTL